MQLWLKADSLALSDNDPVSTWVDSSGSGNDATQAGALRPTYKTSIVNGLPVVRFNGTSQYLSSNASVDQKPYSLFVVLNPTDAAAVRNITGCASTGAFVLRMATDRIVHADKSGVANIGTSSSGLTLGSPQLFTFTYSGVGAYGFYIDGTAAGSGTNDQTGSTGGLATQIGGNTADGSYWYGDIAELIKYSVVPTSDEIGHVNQYISDKYGLTISNMVPCAEVVYPSFRIPRLRPAIFKPGLAR